MVRNDQFLVSTWLIMHCQTYRVVVQINLWNYPTYNQPIHPLVTSILNNNVKWFTLPLFNYRLLTNSCALYVSILLLLQPSRRWWWKYIFWLFHCHFTCAWYFKSFLIFPVVKFQTSINPSTLPVTRYCPSGEKAAHSTWDFWPNYILKKNNNVNCK